MQSTNIGNTNQELVNEIMKEMEENNGSYNEETGNFSRTKNNSTTLQSNNTDLFVNELKLMQNQFLSIIDSSDELKELIVSNQNSQELISQIMDNEDFLKDILRPENMPFAIKILKDVLSTDRSSELNGIPNNSKNNVENNENVNKIQNTNQFELVAKNQDLAKKHLLNNDSNTTNIPPNNNMFNSIVGSVIAMLSYFILTQTPLLYYVNNIPYIGSMLSSSSITSILIVGIIFYICNTVLQLFDIL